jgi:hypothetical protein
MSEAWEASVAAVSIIERRNPPEPRALSENPGRRPPAFVRYRLETQQK